MTVRGWPSRRSRRHHWPRGLLRANSSRPCRTAKRWLSSFTPESPQLEKLTDVSGRGVGMDVVKTNLDRLGGKIEIDSAPGKGSRFRIKLPLTLAIIPSLLISSGGERFAIPQVSVGELIRIAAAQIAQRTDRVGDAQVLNLRDRMVPLVYLSDALGLPRSESAGKALNVVLVDTGAFEYGLVVDELHDTVEIVVKPLGRHLKAIPDYAGATILGDGRVAVILDVAGLAARVSLTSGAADSPARQEAGETVEGERHSLLLFENAPGEVCAVPIEQVSRIERVRAGQIEYLGGRRTMQYRGNSLPVVTLHDAASVRELAETQRWIVIVFESMGQSLGLLAAEPLDMVETTLAIDTVTLRQRGIAGSAVLKNRTLLILDIFDLVLPRGPNVGAPNSATRRASANSSDEKLHRAGGGRFRFLPRSGAKTGWKAVGCRVLAAEVRADSVGVIERARRRGVSGGYGCGNAETGRPGTHTTDPRRSALHGVAHHYALSSLAGEEEIARGHGRWRQRIPGQAQQGRVNREHPQSDSRNQPQAVAGNGWIRKPK